LSRALAETVPQADPAGLDDDAHRRVAHLRREQLKMLCAQATRSPFAVIIAVLFVAFVVWEFVPGWKVIAWAAVLLAFPIGRGVYSAYTLRRLPADASAGLRVHLASMLTGGIVVGLSAPLFFEALPEERRAILTMILVCWAAAAVSPLAAYARAYYAYVAPIVLQVAAAWATAGSGIDPAERFVAAALIVFAGVILSFFVRDNERVLRESFEIRYENERLIAALERERQEVALARDKAEAADRAKSRFLAAASHDLRQPLHALSLHSAALSLQFEDGDVGKMARNIAVSVQSLEALVDSLLHISKLEARTVVLEIQRVHVRDLIDRIETTFRSVAQEKGLEFRVSSVDADVETDPTHLERILRNLVDNALKHTARGSVTLSAESAGAGVRFAVRDTGPGIPPEKRALVFQPFYQIDKPGGDRPTGFGLGLTIVAQLADLLGTGVELDSTPGRGAEFAIRLPRARRALEAEQPAPASAPRPARRLAGTQVLVIDDEPTIRVGMRTLLEAWGCQVTVAGGRAEAERLLDEHGLGFDVIVADFRLREHENGIETIRQLRARIGEEVPALLITGDTAPERLREAHESGLPLLHKPVVPPEKLQEALLNAMSR
jgi:signal transduction histidine kinase/CheY-like chemotaxis protein